MNSATPQVLRAIAAAVAIGLGLNLLTSPETADARHRLRMVENGYFNPNGGINGNLYGINIDWELTGASNMVCHDWGPNYSQLPLGIQDGIAAWEPVLSGTQLFTGCPGGRSATWFLRRSVRGLSLVALAPGRAQITISRWTVAAKRGTPGVPTFG